MATEPLGPLSLPEAMALLGGEDVDAEEVVFLALLELVARRALEIVPLAGGREHGLRPLEGAPHLTGRPLVSIIELLREAIATDPRAATGVTTAKYSRRRFAERWGTASGYVRFEVWTTLKERGLSGASDGRATAAIWDLTDSGAAERKRILHAGTREDWRRRPATTLLRAVGLPIPSDETFDILDELEDDMTPGTPYNPLQHLVIGPP